MAMPFHALPYLKTCARWKPTSALEKTPNEINDLKSASGGGPFTFGTIHGDSYCHTGTSWQSELPE